MTHSESTFNNINSVKSNVNKHSGTRIKPRPTFNLSIDKLYYVTEKEENQNWNELSNKALEEKVRQSIKDVDNVLKLRDYPNITKSISTADQYKPEIVIIEESPTQTESPTTPFERFRLMLKNGINAEISENSLSSWRISKNSPIIDNAAQPLEDDEFQPQPSTSPNLRYK